MWVQSLGWEDAPEEGMATTPYSCLENCSDKRAWWATVQEVTKRWTQLKILRSYIFSNRNINNILKLYFHFSNDFLYRIK